MYAIVETGGKQYKVKEGDFLRIEKVEGEVGTTFDLDQVLCIGGAEEVAIGRPLVDGAKVTCEILAQDRARKILVFKKKRRKGFQKLLGHRQPYTAVRVAAIER